MTLAEIYISCIIIKKGNSIFEFVGTVFKLPIFAIVVYVELSPRFSFA